MPGSAKVDQQVSEPLARNIETLMQRRRQNSANENITEKLAAGMAAFTGSVWSILLHSVLFGAWILINTGVTPFFPTWDPSLVVLAMIASVEAIFLTTFVLMNQRRQARTEEDRAAACFLHERMPALPSEAVGEVLHRTPAPSGG